MKELFFIYESKKLSIDLANFKISSENHSFKFVVISLILF